MSRVAADQPRPRVSIPLSSAAGCESERRGEGSSRFRASMHTVPLCGRPTRARAWLLEGDGAGSVYALHGKCSASPRLVRSRFIPANPQVRFAVRRSARCPVDIIGLHFFFSFDLSYLRAAGKPSLAGAREVGTKISCCPHFHCAEWSCVVLNYSPRLRIKLGKDWPV
jgi:hypothetical protein